MGGPLETKILEQGILVLRQSRLPDKRLLRSLLSTLRKLLGTPPELRYNHHPDRRLLDQHADGPVLGDQRWQAASGVLVDGYL